MSEEKISVNELRQDLRALQQGIEEYAEINETNRRLDAQMAERFGMKREEIAKDKEDNARKLAKVRQRQASQQELDREEAKLAELAKAAHGGSNADILIWAKQKRKVEDLKRKNQS